MCSGEPDRFPLHRRAPPVRRSAEYDAGLQRGARGVVRRDRSILWKPRSRRSYSAHYLATHLTAIQSPGALIPVGRQAQASPVSCLVFDVFSESTQPAADVGRSLGRFQSGELELEVPPHGSRLFILSECK